MKLCKFVIDREEDSYIWINPANVVAVIPQFDGTQITTTGVKDGRPYSVYVPDTAEQVAAVINEALR